MMVNMKGFIFHMELMEKAYAKINISLDVAGKMADGYHELKMVMESVSLYDDVKVRVDSGKGVNASTNLSYLPTDERNIAVKAAQLFFTEMKIQNKKAEIKIFKRIPVCAGLAGGSSDAAAVLRALNRMLGTGLSSDELEKMGERLGSDVPYCVAGGTMLAQGRGEQLTPLPAMPRCAIVVCKPAFSVSTSGIFSKLECEKIRHRPDTRGIIEALEKHSLAEIAHRVYNVFEDLPYKGKREIMEIKEAVLSLGAIGAAMSGTGPAVFGIFDDEEKACAAMDTLSKKHKDTFLTNNIERLKV